MPVPGRVASDETARNLTGRGAGVMPRLYSILLTAIAGQVCGISAIPSGGWQPVPIAPPCTCCVVSVPLKMVYRTSPCGVRWLEADMRVRQSHQDASLWMFSMSGVTEIASGSRGSWPVCLLNPQLQRRTGSRNQAMEEGCGVCREYRLPEQCETS